MATDLILGTAGHIDHGKSSLVRALTGTDTDRLPEEKRRGITIELGFAQLVFDEFRLGIVDVPGHEKFVRQMLAGATGMDIAMFVVAANDSVQPQTREHLDVLRLLDLPAGVIALTKCDLAEDAWMTLVEEEIRELVSGTFLENAPIIRTSASTGEGLDDLRVALAVAAQRSAANRKVPSDREPFRMAVDRSFTIDGHGTVVTGSVASGRANLGDELTLQPQGAPVRVRGLHQHEAAVELVERGQRAAMNLAGIHHTDLLRGHELASPGHLVASRLLTVEVDVLRSAARPLKTRQRVRLHVGTAEILATVTLLDHRTSLAPGSHSFAQLTLREPAAVIWNQPFILRAESPVTTIGGGHVLVPGARRMRKPHAMAFDTLKQLQSKDESQRALAAAYFVGLSPWNAADLVRLAGISDPESVVEELLRQKRLVRLEVTPQRTQWIHPRILEEWHERIRKALALGHQEQPLKLVLERPVVMARFGYLNDDPLLAAILQNMHAAAKIRLTPKSIADASHQVHLTEAQQKLRTEIVERFREARFQPPTISEYQLQWPKQAKDVDRLIRLAAATDELVHVDQEMFIHAKTESELKRRLTQAMTDDGMTLKQIRELLDTTRKYAVPFCEHLDRVGFTVRKGDRRFLKN